MAAQRRESTIMGPTVDADGRCPRHPFLRLRRRSALTGEWVTLLDSCPVCLVEGEGDDDDEEKKEERSPPSPSPPPKSRSRSPYNPYFACQPCSDDEDSADDDDNPFPSKADPRRLREWQRRGRLPPGKEPAVEASRSDDGRLDRLAEELSRLPRHSPEWSQAKKELELLKLDKEWERFTAGSPRPQRHRPVSQPPRRRLGSYGGSLAPIPERRRRRRDRGVTQSASPGPSSLHRYASPSPASSPGGRYPSPASSPAPTGRCLPSASNRYSSLSPASSPGRYSSPSPAPTSRYSSSLSSSLVDRCPTSPDSPAASSSLALVPYEAGLSVATQASRDGENAITFRDLVQGWDAEARDAELPHTESDDDEDDDDTESDDDDDDDDASRLQDEKDIQALARRHSSDGARDLGTDAGRGRTNAPLRRHASDGAQRREQLASEPPPRFIDDDDGDDDCKQIPLKHEKEQVDMPSPGTEAKWDSKGRCVRHPHQRLRKKKLFGGWKVLLTVCPDCCMEELMWMKLEAQKSKMVEASSPAAIGYGRKGSGETVTTCSSNNSLNNSFGSSLSSLLSFSDSHSSNLSRSETERAGPRSRFRGVGRKGSLAARSNSTPVHGGAARYSASASLANVRADGGSRLDVAPASPVVAGQTTAGRASRGRFGIGRRGRSATRHSASFANVRAPKSSVAAHGPGGAGELTRDQLLQRIARTRTNSGSAERRGSIAARLDSMPTPDKYLESLPDTHADGSVANQCAAPMRREGFAARSNSMPITDRHASDDPPNVRAVVSQIEKMKKAQKNEAPRQDAVPRGRRAVASVPTPDRHGSAGENEGRGRRARGADSSDVPQRGRRSLRGGPRGGRRGVDPPADAPRRRDKYNVDIARLESSARRIARKSSQGGGVTTRATIA